MMHSTCFNSNVAVRCNGSFSLSYRDSSNFLLDDRFDRNPIQSCCCYCCCSCCCSANSICGFPTNPNSILYGLRQSALIQWAPSRRVVLHGARQSCFSPRFSGRSEVGRRGYYYEKLYSLKERSLNGMMGKWGSGGFECRGLSERRSRYPFGSFEDTVDVMLSILTEDVVEEPLGGRERNARLSRRLQVEKREKVTTDDSSDKITKKKKKTGTGRLQGRLKCDYEFSGTHSREEDKRLRNDERRKDESEIVVRGENSRARTEQKGSSYRDEIDRARKEQKGSSYRDEIDRARKEQKESSYRDEIDRARKEEKGSFSKSENHRARKEEKGSFSRSENHRARKEVKESFSRTENHDARKDENESFSRNENHKLRKEGSSCSSYYSLSSTGDIESDDELEVKQGKYVGESSSVYERDGKRYHDEDVSERFDRHKDFVVDQQIVSEKKYSADELYEDSKRVNYDWRKETEKKLSETPTKQMESREELAEEKLRLSAFKRKANIKSSDLSQKYDGREKSTLSININEERGQQNVQRTEMITGQFESRTKYKQFAELSSEISGSNIETTSSSQKQYIGTEENFTQMVGSVQETTGKQVAGRVIRVDSRKQIPERVNDVSALQEIDIRGTSSSLPETTLSTLEGDSATVVGLLDHTKEEEQRTSQLVTKQAGSILNSQQFTGISETVNINNQITLVSCSNSNVRTNMQEQRSDTSFPQAKVTDTQKVPQKRLSIEESSSTSVINTFGESKERLDLIGVGVSQTESAKDTRTRRTTKASSFHVGMPKEAAIPYKPLKLNPESSEKPIRAYVGVTDSSQPSIVTATKPEPVSSRPLNVEPVHELSSEWSDFGTSELRIQAEKNSELLGTDKRGDLHEESVNFISHDDALHSAARQQNSSTHIVGEFVEMVRHGISTSQIQEDTKIHEMDLIHGDGQHKQKTSSKDGSTRSHRKDDGSGRLSRGSGREGPSDEMWHVNDQSSQGPPETDAVENTSTTENGSVKRSGRSLWNVIGDIVRMRWGSRSETLTSKSGGKNSPNQSTSSEAWFSGHEQDENNDENAKVERPITPQESSSGEKQQSEEIPSPSRGDVLSPIRSKNEIAEAGLDMQLSSNTNIGSTSVGASSSLAEESYVIEGTSSGTAIVKASLPLPAIRLGRSPAVKDISEAGQANAYGQGTMVEMEQQVPTRVTEITTTDGSGSGIMVEIEQQVPSNVAEVLATTDKNGELKRRKLQRKDQVLKDRFDEWEEAHIRETEQRKIDETFMREALSEARKAADVWEVPVGAVLVQDGKIIARGYNLVEELRDSTAHAEMICIREASKVLRTWRLSETTLYVTLEPCPMCAGAIFQARVDTVVWGAPNKLLGADGSWIRLFPDGAGSSESELTDKPPAPVHPFHPNITIRRGVLSSECADVMQQFFQLRRKKKEKREPPTPPSCLPISHHHSKFFTKMHDAFNIMFCL